MIKNILGTLFTRIISAVLTFIIWVLNANYLEAEQVGTLSLMVFSVALIQLITNFLAGSALIYYTPRMGVYRLLVPTYMLVPLFAIFGFGLMEVVGWLWPVARVIPESYPEEVFILALIISFVSANYMFLLGREMVKEFNRINLIQIVSLFAGLLFFLFILKRFEVMAFYVPLTVSYILTFILSLSALRKYIKRESLKGTRGLLKEVFSFGAWVQLANVFQTLNYRMSLKFVDHYLGVASVGVLSIGMQLAEGLWLISRSLGTVQYSRMSNAMDFTYSVKLTISFIKISVIMTALGMVLLLSIPQSVFMLVFPESFRDVKMVIASLAPGIVMLSGSIIFSGFFSAINAPRHNMISSAAGLLVTITGGIALVPCLGLPGAGLAASLTYSVITIWQFVVFLRMTKINPGAFLPQRNEFRLIISEVKKMVG